ncbi:MAG: methyltransferase domain-containing protein [Myxococcales bacterium]|nr:methyltransferase domain-containing protein [Myxococcales bacterium]
MIALPDQQLVPFLQWALPRLGMRWRGFRKVRRQVKRRIARRLDALGLTELGDYRALLERDAREWAALDACCRVTISRFYRDHGVWRHLTARLPEMARAAGRELRALSLGCASGEEPYTLAILARELDLPLRVVACDVSAELVARARAGRYPSASAGSLPAAWRTHAFAEREAGVLEIAAPLRSAVAFFVADVRRLPLRTRFDVVLCRNLAFTYFDAKAQARVLDALVAVMAPGALLVLGMHEQLDDPRLAPDAGGNLPVCRRRP